MTKKSTTQPPKGEDQGKEDSPAAVTAIRLPVKRKADKILAIRDGVYKWFTQAGWDLLGDVNYHDSKGNLIRKKRQGWEQVDEAGVAPPPPPVQKT